MPRGAWNFDEISDFRDHTGPLPLLATYQPMVWGSNTCGADPPIKNSAFGPHPPLNGCHSNNPRSHVHGRGDDDDDFRVDIEVFSCRPMRIGVQPYRSPAQPTHHRHGNKVGGGLRVHRLRLSVLALHPIYRRRLRKLRGTGTAASSPGRHRHQWRKHFLNRVTFEMESFKISDDQVRVATEIFKKFDKRGQDKISTNDLGPAFRALKVPITPDLIKEWADEVDNDATGLIDLKGFISVYCKILQNEQDEQDLRQAFRALDKNGRGEIDVEDLRWILKELGDELTDEEIDEMIRDTDRDGSGFVDFNEFKKLMTSE